jgi:hypothetical protein
VAGPWGDYVDLQVDIGLDARWSAALSRWDVDTWASGEWVWSLSADWHPVDLGTLLAVDTAMGSGDLVTPAPGSVGSVTLWDRDGLYAPSAEGWWLGAQLRVKASVNGRAHKVIFWGTIAEPTKGGTVGVPEVTITANDALATWAAARLASAPGNATQTVVARLNAVADAIHWPLSGRDFAADTTSLAPDDTVGALDVATRAVTSAHGFLWADPADPYTVIRYRPASFLASLDETDAAIGIIAGEPPLPTAKPNARPTDLTGTLRLGDVFNVVSCADMAGAGAGYAEDAASIARYGRLALNPVTDLALATVGELNAWAAVELARHQEPRARADAVTVTVYDDASAEAAALRIGDVVWIGDTARTPGGPGAGWGFAALVTALGWSATATSLDIAVTGIAVDDISLPTTAKVPA